MPHHSARRGDGYSDQRIMHPARDWFVGLVGAAVLFLGSSVGAGYLFWSKSNATADASGATIDPVKYDPKLIKRVLTDYGARYARYESLQADIISVPEATSTATTTATSTSNVKPASTASTTPVAQ